MEVAERFADMQATAVELQAARDARPASLGDEEFNPGFVFHYLTAEDEREAIKYWKIGVNIGREAGLGWRSQVVALGSIVRDIFGNPFRPVSFDPEWRSDTVVSLAKHIYAARDFAQMPILADALQDAGCDNADILNHCRDTSASHVRGCWVVDMVLSRT